MKTIPANPQETAISTTHHKYSDGRWTRRGKEKLVADPKKNWDTMVAEIAEAKTRAGAAGDEVPFLHACPSHEAAQALGGNGADLNRRPFTAQRQARADA